MKYWIMALSACVFMINTLQAQSLDISGQVLDEAGLPLPGAIVHEKGTGNGTSTNFNGLYALEVSSPSASIVVSFVGYVAQEIPVDSRSEINVQLRDTLVLIGPVVITALGIERERKDLGYAIQELEAKEISEVKSANFVDQLAGQIAGVSVSQGATGVGSSSRISIRGEASFTNNNPLFVVDGTPINNNSIINLTNEAAAGFQEVDFGNGAMEVNPDDIASVSVLKGPSAAALYGTRAANGVILITTKDGSDAKGFGIDFNSTTSIETAFQLPEFQNSYGQGNAGQFEFVDGLGGGTNDNITYSWGPALDQGLSIAQFDSPVTLADGSIVRGGDVAVHGGATISPSPFNSNPDNLKSFYRTGSTLINSLAIKHGSDCADVRVSYTDLRSKSIIPGVNLDRNTLSARLQFRPSDKLKINSSWSYINSSSDNRPSGGYGSENINYSLVAWGPRSMDTGVLEDYWQPGLEGVQQYSFNYTFFDNPYFILLENRNSFSRNRIFGNLSATYEWSKEWSISARSGLDNSYENRAFRRAFSTNRFKQGAYAEHSVGFREANADVLVNWKRDLGQLRLDLSAGANRLNQYATSLQVQALSLAQPGIFSLNNAASPTQVFQQQGDKRINSVYGLAKLAYRGFLYVDITGRKDWSSALATATSSDNVGFFYPSVSASLILSQISDLGPSISFAKVRASWAQVGNDTDPYQTSTAFVAQVPYNSQPTFSAQNFIANAGLRPEQTTATEFGVDLRFYDDRLRFDLTYYNALTDDQIISLPVPISSGYTQQVVNGGAVRSQGIELVLGATPVYKPGFRWDVTANFTRAVATVETLAEGIDRLTLAYSRVYDNVNQTVWYQVEEGGRIGDIYGTGYARNADGDFLIGEDGKFIVDNELKKLGNYTPDFMLGLSNAISVKQWDFSALLEWRQGGIIVSRTQALAGVAGQLLETGDRPDLIFDADGNAVGGGIIAEGVSADGSPNTVPVSAETYYRQFYDRNHEENNVYDASYLKIRQVAIGYSFPTQAEKGLLQRGRTLKLSLIGRNLFAFSAIPHFDPEQSAVQGQNFLGGVEDMSYASSRSVGAKISYSF